MRVIAGKHKGRGLITVSGSTVRPTTDRVKEAVFNLIRNKTDGAVVLDLFAGSGALGIEAISRSATSAVFCDHSRDAITCIKNNLAKLHENAEVIHKDYRAAISELAHRGFIFDIIFIDPPYDANLESDVLALIADKEILNADGIIVLERRRGDPQYKLPQAFAETVTRDYGASTISIVKRATKVALTGTFDPFTLGHKYLVEKALEKFDIVHVVVLTNPDKKPTFTLKKRLHFIEKSLKPYRKRLKIVFFPGLVIDYCKQSGIQYIIRGFRSAVDSQYEEQMAEYNKTHGGVETILISAKDTGISSTIVKERMQAKENIDMLVDKSILNEILAEEKKWKT
jgi:16S rRNA (guanine(966)-N(2))-methyltransferase RsmD/pantetheine-phosphate adenylyltransferase